MWEWWLWWLWYLWCWQCVLRPVRLTTMECQKRRAVREEGEMRPWEPWEPWEPGESGDRAGVQPAANSSQNYNLQRHTKMAPLCGGAWGVLWHKYNVTDCSSLQLPLVGLAGVAVKLETDSQPSQESCEDLYTAGGGRLHTARGRNTSRLQIQFVTLFKGGGYHTS